MAWLSLASTITKESCENPQVFDEVIRAFGYPLPATPIHRTHDLRTYLQKSIIGDVLSPFESDDLHKVEDASPFTKLEALHAVVFRLHFRNAEPLLLFEEICPAFFKWFPAGRIFIVRHDLIERFTELEIELSQAHFGWSYDNVQPIVWQETGTPGLRVSAGPEPPAHNAVQSGWWPQSITGFSEEGIPVWGLTLALGAFQPYVYGLLNFCGHVCIIFLPNKPINMFAEYEPNIFERFYWGLDYIQSDDTGNIAGYPIRRIRIETPWSVPEFSTYLEWTIDRLNNLLDWIWGLKDEIDDATCYLALMTCCRICVELCFIDREMSPLPRKNLAYDVVDKFASLVSSVSRTSRSEVETWEDLWHRQFFEDKIAPIIQKMPSPFDGYFADLGASVAEDIESSATHTYFRSDAMNNERRTIRWPLDSKEEAMPIPDWITELLRAHRNLHHGYLLRESQLPFLLAHTGEISNSLPDFPITLWHAFLQDPQFFVNLWSSP